jgi:hypothetical protein
MERSRQQAQKRADARTPEDAETARQRTMAMAEKAYAMHPGALPGILMQAMSTPTAADEFKGSQAEKNMSAGAVLQTQIDKLKGELQQLQNKRDVATRRRHADPDAVTKQYAPDIERVQKRLDALYEQQGKGTASRAESEKGFAETAPWWQKALLTGGPPVASVLTSLPLGRLAPGPLAYGLGIFGSGFEGGLAAFVPEYEDLKLPDSSPAKQEALRKLKDWNYWATEVLPEAGISAGIGGLSTMYGHKWKTASDALRAQKAAAKLAPGTAAIAPAQMTPKPLLPPLPVGKTPAKAAQQGLPAPWGYPNLSTEEFDKMVKRPRTLRSGGVPKPADDLRSLNFLLKSGIVPPKE